MVLPASPKSSSASFPEPAPETNPMRSWFPEALAKQSLNLTPGHCTKAPGQACGLLQYQSILCENRLEFNSNLPNHKHANCPRVPVCPHSGARPDLSPARSCPSLRQRAEPASASPGSSPPAFRSRKADAVFETQLCLAEHAQIQQLLMALAHYWLHRMDAVSRGQVAPRKGHLGNPARFKHLANFPLWF